MNNMNLKQIRKLLYPAGLLYGGITAVRNKLFDCHILNSKSYNLPVISVGNITVGGTGKTPLTEYIVNLLNGKGNTALLSRGYKRQTKGVVVGTKTSKPAELGDEPSQLNNKFKNLQVVVAEKRVDGIDTILSLSPKIDYIVCDDAYQHRHINPGLKILVIDYNRPLWKDTMLPAGELREWPSGKNRADIIIFSKCPFDLSATQKETCIQKIKPKHSQSVFFTSISYGSIIPLFGKDINFPKNENLHLLALTGIAQPKPFLDHVAQIGLLCGTLKYPDHHNFSDHDLRKVTRSFAQIEEANKAIVTTEKDAVRIKELTPDKGLLKNIFYIPIEIRFLFNEKKQFDNTITNYVEKNKRDC